MEKDFKQAAARPLDIADVQPQDLLVLIEIFGRDGNFDVSALLQSYFVPVLVN